jgi:hypothetical protein
MKYVVIDGVYIPVNMNDEGDYSNYKLGEAYVFGDDVYINKGISSDDVQEPGLYISEDDGEPFIIEYEGDKSLTVKDIVTKQMDKKENLLNSIMSLPKSDSTKKRRVTSDDDDDEDGKSRRKSDNNKFLGYEVSDDDDDIVRLLKETVNEKQITMQDVYDKSESDQAGYNLIYGLRQRNSISYNSVLKWAKILDMDVRITLVDKVTK